MNELGNNLKRLLGLHALPARGFASLVPISSQAVSEIMGGKRGASLSTAQSIAAFFEIPLDRLLNTPFTELLPAEIADTERYDGVEAKITEEARVRSFRSNTDTTSPR